MRRCAGLLVAEVQTPSDTTFRVFDFNRIDPATGKPRALHVEEALQCIDFSSTGAEPRRPDADARLVTSPYFHLVKVRIEAGGLHRFECDGPVILIITEGRLEVDGSTSLARRGFAAAGIASKSPSPGGDSVLLPCRYFSFLTKRVRIIAL